MFDDLKKEIDLENEKKVEEEPKEEIKKETKPNGDKEFNTPEVFTREELL